VIRRVIRYVDERTGAAPFLRKALRYVFPDHWSFLLGEVALYAFVVLVLTGIYLTLFFKPSLAPVQYHGGYAPLQGSTMSEAYQSTVDISLRVKAGLLFRQTHHWAADVFIAAIVLHLLRIFFTGAFRKPRDLTYYIGLLMLMTALLEGYLGYSMVDDLLSGMGLAIGYSVLMSVPFIGANLAQLIWGGPFPTHVFESRMYIAHVFLFPILIATLIALHLTLVASRHHTQFRGGRGTERKVVGVPTFPGETPRSLGLLFAVAAVLFLMGGLIQINPIWQWGPYHPYLSENGAQPDWYIGWLIGALRLMPNFEPAIGSHTIIPNPFWGGALFPLVVFGVMFAWPSIERRFTGDHRRHDLLDRPRDRPVRTAIGAAFLSWVVIIFAVGSTDRLFFRLHISYDAQIHFWRIGVWVLPILIFFITRSACRSLAVSNAHPLRAWQGAVVRRGAGGGVEILAHSPDVVQEPASQAPEGTAPGDESD
jgi:ubiquinol-cytochrome c reductase cytochrome b subunit